MIRSARFQLTYDASSDVLYVSLRNDEAVKGVEDAYGLVWRYAKDGHLIGMTVMDFQDFWAARSDALALEMSKHFHIPNAEADKVLRLALKS